MSTPEAARVLLLFDGVCGLCHRVTRFVLPRDRHDRFRFAPLQSRLARRILERHGKDAGALDTFYLVFDRDQPTERVIGRARAALEVGRLLGGFWALSAVFRILPDRLLDWLYDRVASVRYRLFGKHDLCSIPSPAERAKFLGFDEIDEPAAEGAVPLEPPAAAAPS